MAEKKGVTSPWWDLTSQNWRLVAACYSFLVLGAIDASYGALLPYLSDYYDLSYTLVSLIFLPPLIGYIGAALLVDVLHRRFGQRGVAILGPICHLITFVIVALHPPYPVMLVAISISGFGNGILDAAWNAWVSDMEAANQLMAALHCLYGVGAFGSPLVATAMITKGHAPWYTFYYVLLGIGFLELLMSSVTFSKSGPEGPSEPDLENEKGEQKPTRSALWASLKEPTTWVMSLLGFFYMGAEVSIGGWLPTFLLNARGASPFAAGMALTGFWLSTVVGTLLLGFLGSKIGPRLVVFVCFGLILILQLVVWLVPRFFAATVPMALIGFLMGPIFPTAIIVAVKLLPSDLHVTAVGLISTVGCAGSTVFPFIVGVVAQKVGVKILPPFVFGLFGLMLIMWLLAPTKKRVKEAVGDDIQVQVSIDENARGRLGSISITVTNPRSQPPPDEQPPVPENIHQTIHEHP